MTETDFLYSFCSKAVILSYARGIRVLPYGVDFARRGVSFKCSTVVAAYYYTCYSTGMIEGTSTERHEWFSFPKNRSHQGCCGSREKQTYTRDRVEILVALLFGQTAEKTVSFRIFTIMFGTRPTDERSRTVRAIRGKIVRQDRGFVISADTTRPGTLRVRVRSDSSQTLTVTSQYIYIYGNMLHALWPVFEYAYVYR